MRAAGFQPGVLGDLHLSHRFFRCFAESGARFQIRDVGDVAAIFLTVKYVNVVITHRFGPQSLNGILPRRARIVEPDTAWPAPRLFCKFKGRLTSGCTKM